MISWGKSWIGSSQVNLSPSSQDTSKESDSTKSAKSPPAYVSVPALAGTVFVLVGVYYWRTYSHESPFDCLYGDKDCSLAVGTWLLGFVTLAAFLAAASAAVFAARAYVLETKGSLGHRRCSERRHFNEPDVTLYIASLTKEPQRYRPTESVRSDFISEHHAFLNLGRSPLVAVTVDYQIRVLGRQAPFIGKLQLDCIPVDGEVHVAIYRLKALIRANVAWEVPAAQDKAKLDFVPAAGFHATPIVPPTPPSPAAT